MTTQKNGLTNMDLSYTAMLAKNTDFLKHITVESAVNVLIEWTITALGLTTALELELISILLDLWFPQFSE